MAFDAALQQMLSEGRLSPRDVLDILELERRLSRPWWWPALVFVARLLGGE